MFVNCNLSFCFFDFKRSNQIRGCFVELNFVYLTLCNGCKFVAVF